MDGQTEETKKKDFHVRNFGNVHDMSSSARNLFIYFISEKKMVG
jgi:hypothetical protein